MLKKIIITYVIFLNGILLFGQSATVTTTVMPPYNAPFDQLKEQLSAIVMNTSNQDPITTATLRLHIEGDNGIVIQTIDLPTQLNTFDINELDTVNRFGNMGEFDGIFLMNNLLFQGVNPNDVYNNGLPDGSYTLCLRLYDENSNPVSPEGTGCTMFTIINSSNVTVNTTVTFPFSRDIFNYSSNTMVTLQTSLGGDVSLFIDFKGDNGVHLQTRQDYLPFNIVLSGNMNPQIITSMDLESYFEFQNLVSLGMPIAQIQQDGLPPGQYQICIRVRNVSGGFISGEDPLGCSNFFSINAIEPPQLITPFCGDDITTGNNNIVFSWTMPPGTNPSTTEYTLKMIELLPNQDPNQAFLASTVPAFFEKTVTTQTSILYGPTDPPLESGKSYAWQIIASDFELNTPFVNDGRSEVCWFTWKPNEITFIPILTDDEDDDNIINTGFTIDPQPRPISSLTGRLLYKFENNSSGFIISGSSATDNLNFGNQNPNVPATGYYIDPAGGKPLSGVSVSLVVTYLFNGNDNNGSYKFLPVNGNQSGYISNKNKQSQDQILATTITDGNGNFSFSNFTNPFEDYGLVQADIDATTNSDVQNQWMKGDVYKVLRLKVNNQYYLSPDNNIVLNPWESKDIGEVVSLVKSYNLKVKAKWFNQSGDVKGGEGKELQGIRLNLGRTTVPSNIPTDEGEKENITFLYTLVAEGYTDKNATVLFKNLVQHNQNNANDRYKIIPGSTDESEYTFKLIPKTFNKTKIKGTLFGKPFPFNTVSYKSGLPQQGITWNHELVVKEYEETIELIPTKPKIIGELKTTDVNSRALNDEVVFLVNKRKYPNRFPNIKPLMFTKTDNQGRFRFDNLSMEFGKEKHTQAIENDNGSTSYYNYWDVEGPSRKLISAVRGFKSQTKNVELLKWGSQFQYTFSLEPDGYIKGYVVDEQGNAIKAIVNVDGLAKKRTSFGYIKTETINSNSSGYTLQNGMWTQSFAFKAPSGERKIEVAAVSDNATNYSVYKGLVNIPKTNTTNSEPLKIVLTKKQKRIRFKVVEYNTTTAIKNAKVTLKDIAGFETPKLTDNEGYVEFIFENIATDFSFNINPPEGKVGDYTSQKYDVVDIENTTEFTTFPKDAYLKKAAKINGVVTLDGNVLEDAKVFFQIDTQLIETITNNKGEYSLKGIANDIGTIELTASKTGETPNIISKSKSITIKGNNTVNFDLKIDKEVSLSSIYGFKIEIIEKEKKDENTYIIKRGNLIEIPKNQNFSFRENHDQVVLPFSNVTIKKTNENDDYGTPIFKPEKKQITLNAKTLDLKLNKAFNVVLGEDSNQLKLSKVNEKGQIQAKVGIENNSFNTSNITLENDKAIYLTSKKGSKEMNIIAFAIEKSKVDNYGIINSKGKELTFKLGNFDAKAKQDKSYIQNNEITLYTHLKTQKIEGLTPDKIEIEAGNLILQPTKIIPISNSNPLKFKLEDWSFESENWDFDTKNLELVISKGIIKTGSVNVPANNITLSSSEFNIDSFNLNELMLGGIAKLDVIGKNASFGLNQNVGSDNQAHWELRITGENNNPAATLNLPGFETGKAIAFNMVSMLSNGEQKTATANNKSMKFYNIINVTPTNITFGDGYININSMTDLGIPRIPESSGFIGYKKENGELVATVSPMSFVLDAPGKVKFLVNNKPENTEIKDGFFKAIGTLKDEEGINLQASIQKSASDIHIEIEPGQKMQLGNSDTAFKDIEGRIDLDSNNDWEKLTFSGELEGFKGVASGQRQTFTVHGSITADEESIDVDNIETPFGDLALTYDIKNSRFLGHLNINQPLGGMKFVGSADMLMGSSGWYFSAGGIGTPPGIGEISVGLIIGDSDYLAPDVTGNLMQFAYNKNIPSTISNGVSGLFVTGQKVIPIINIPDWSLDLGILSASLGAKAGLDARVWMNFDSSGNEFGIGLMAFAHVYFEASSITCTTLGADARAELGLTGMYQTSTGDFNIDGCGSISVSGHIEQCFPTLVAGCKGCVSAGFSESVKLNMHLDSGGNTDVSFGFGNCSGAPLSSN